MKKRLLSAALALAMVLTMLPMSAFAVEGETGDSQTPETGDQTPGTGTTTPDDTQEPTTPPTVDKAVVPAILHDTRLDSEDDAVKAKGIADDKLVKDLDTTVGAEANGVVPVTLVGTNLKSHLNGDDPTQNMGYWFGIAIPAPEAAKKMKVVAKLTKDGADTAFESAEARELIANITKDGKSGFVQYLDRSHQAYEAGKFYVKLQWLDESSVVLKDADQKEIAPVVYEIDFQNVKIAEHSVTIGFDAAGDNANKNATALKKTLYGDTASAITDCERETIYAAIDGLDPRNEYTVELHKDGAKIATFVSATGRNNGFWYDTFKCWEGSGNPGIVENDQPVALSAGIYKMVLKWTEGETAKTAESNALEIVEVTVDPTSNGVLAVKAGTDEKKPFEAIADGADKGKIKLFAVKGQEKAAFDGIITATANDGWKFDSWTANEANTVFTAKFVAAQISTVSASAENATLTAELKKDGDKNVIAISGLAPVSTTKVTVSYKLDGDNEEAAARTSEITVENTANTTNFTVAADTKITVGGVDYMIDVTGMVASDVKLVDAAPVVDADSLEDTQLTDEQKEEATDAASSVNIPKVADAVLKQAATLNTAVAAEKTDEKLTIHAGNLVKAGITDATKDNVTVVAQPTMNVKIDSYDPTNKKLSLDISAGYRLLAVKTTVVDNSEAIKVDGEVESGANAIVVGESDELTVNTPVEISVELPAAIVKPGADAALTNIAVLHAKDGDHYHSADVVASGTDPDFVYTATFTSTDGLSPFTFAAVELVAEVDGKQYTTLQAAVDSIAVNGTATITLLAEPAETTVNKVVTITLDAGDSGYTITENTLKAGDNVNKAFDEETNTFTFTSKGSTGPAPGGVGGSSGSATYSVNVPTAEHGTVTVNPRNAAKDATVTITVAPDKGYHLESLTVTDKDGNKIELTKVDATKYTFKMPASRVEVKAVFAEGEAPAVSFTDVAEGEYYYDAVKWAVDKGVTNGLTDTTFGPNASCTRAQMVTFLWRAAGSPEPTATTTAFTDIDANEYYYKAVLWAVEKGITTGTTETTFSPNATVTRAQTVTFLYRYAGSPAVSGSNNFTDLEAGEYYINAVQWAATNGITTGTTETTFSPANNCTRGQIVTFLYRHIVK